LSLLQKFIEPVFFHRWRGIGTRIDLRLVFWSPEKEEPTPMTDQKIAFLLAPGAGAPSMHPRMKSFASLLGSIGSVHSFDYAYATEGRKSPDRLPKLIDTHRAALDALRQKHSGPIFLVGKSMGGRVGCHVALVEKVAGNVCLGYPLCGGGDPSRLRDEVLLSLSTPVLFVQGTRDRLCPLDLLEGVRSRMSAVNDLHIVDGGDHSLLVSKTELKARGTSQDDADLAISNAISAFCSKALNPRAHT
jgi:predicted alpha/beta-hydrolase family hydrolase